MQWSKSIQTGALIAALVATVGAVPGSTSQAQANPTIITLALPSFMADAANSGAGKTILQQFETAHPGVHIEIVSKDAQIPPAATGLSNYLKAVQDYAAAADVVYASDSFLEPEATRAGYFLDLQPLVTADSNANADDFYPAAWKAFQWDGGFWALPTSIDGYVLAYNPSAFDAANLNYPAASWTVDDLANAATKLTQKNPDGSVATAGLSFLGRSAEQALIESLIGSSLEDTSASPAMPQLDSPASEKVLDALNKLNQDGAIGSGFSFPNVTPIVVIPLSLMGALTQGNIAIAGGNNSTSTTTPGGTLLAAVALPGGKVALSAGGFAVSAGTEHPNEAYALVQFLTQQTGLAGAGGLIGQSSSPARKSVAANAANTPPAGPGGGPGPAIGIGPQLPADLQPLLDQARNSGLTIADMPYADYLLQALDNMKSGNIQAAAALSTIEAQAIKDQQTAIADKGQTPIVVATPIPIAAAPGKITLNFGLTSNIRPVPNQAEWQQLAQDFVKNDPTVGLVNVQINGTQDLSQNASNYDCFVMPFNAVPGANLTNLLNIDPYLDSDPNFNRSDVIGNTLTQLQQDNKTWALPLMILPEMMSYDPQQFAQSGVPEPTNGWNFSDFVNALQSLKNNSTQPPFVSSSPGGTYLLELIAAAGGLPIDYRTNPPTVNFTDPTTEAAIQQVLDLAKQGYIKYESQAGLTGIVIRTGSADASGRGPAITTQDIALPRPPAPPTGNGTPTASASEANKLVSYPTGTQYNAISYSITTGYISATTKNSDACYRWLSTIAQHPELFSAMPVLHSLLQSPALANVEGADRVNLYKQIDALLSDPKTITFPSVFQGGALPTGFLIEHWLDVAFDAYVQNNSDLNAALQTAQGYGQGFEQCIAALPAYDPTNAQSAAQYKQQYAACIGKVDPSLKDFAKLAGTGG